MRLSDWKLNYSVRNATLSDRYLLEPIFYKKLPDKKTGVLTQPGQLSAINHEPLLPKRAVRGNFSGDDLPCFALKRNSAGILID